MADQDDRRGGCRRVQGDDSEATVRADAFRDGYQSAIRPVRELVEQWYRAAGLSAAADELSAVLDRVVADQPRGASDQPVTGTRVSGSYSQGEVDVLTAAIVEGWAADIGTRTSARQMARWLLDRGWRRTSTPAEGADR